jgi:hypothetical protein
MLVELKEIPMNELSQYLCKKILCECRFKFKPDKNPFGMVGISPNTKFYTIEEVNNEES